jgi:hypothetical protein
MIARKKKERDRLINQILVGGVTLLIGGAIAALVVMFIVRIYG